VTQDTFYNTVLLASFVLAAVVAVVLFFIAAPYGRHGRKGWGPTVSDKVGWIVMEAPSPLIFAALFFWGNPGTWTAIVFLLMWEAHYVYRAFVYPLYVRKSRHRMPLSVVGMGVLFNVMNAYLNGYYLFVLSAGYPTSWLLDPRFALGLALFVGGMWINRRADRTLRTLRSTGGTEYEISTQGLYRYISCPNYFGEIVGWIGWAIATWSLPGLSFATWTAANLAPRAWAHHRWYQATMADYPRERKALVPGLW
jgi:protein-S-isoprenylcysteine O-methyltransferase Ste14